MLSLRLLEGPPKEFHWEVPRVINCAIGEGERATLW
jgi:hypothetical protein